MHTMDTSSTQNTPPKGYSAGYILSLPTQLLALGGGILTVASAPLSGWLTWQLQQPAQARQYRLLGYRVSFGIDWRIPGAYVVILAQYQRRRDLVLAAHAPLMVLTLICTPLLAATNDAVVIAELAILIGNTGSASGDLYITYQVLQMPRGMLLRDLDPQTTLVFETDR
jgi:hypothetical protein